jgi:hypothetical protein
LPVFRIRRGLEGGKNREVHAERLVGHLSATLDFPGQVFRRGLRQRRDETQGACIGNGRHKLCPANPLHSALHDRMLDAKQFGKSRLHAQVSGKCFS